MVLKFSQVICIIDIGVIWYDVIWNGIMGPENEENLPERKQARYSKAGQKGD